MVATLPKWMDVQFLRTASGVLVVAAVLLVLVGLFVLRSISMKVISLLLVAAAVFGLVHYRQTLEHCGRDGCACKLFGQTIPGNHCPNGSG